MRGKVAKRIRKLVYGDEFSPKVREYCINPITKARENTGLRRKYQQTKKEH